MTIERKGQSMSMRTLVGLIIGMLLFIWLLIAGCKVVNAPEDYEKPFFTLAEKIKSINEGETFASISTTVMLDENMALLGFSPVTHTERKMLGDGNLHYLHKKPISGTHMLRPDICLPDQSCVCLCSDLRSPPINSLTEKGTLSEQEKIFLNTPGTNGILIKNEQSNAIIMCEELLCENVGSASFLNNISQAYLSVDYKEIFSKEDKDITSNYQNFLNGFAILRGKSNQAFYAGGDRSTPSKITPITIHKLSNEKIAVCMKPDCDKDFDPIYSVEEERKAIAYRIDETGLIEARGSDYVVIRKGGTCTVTKDYHDSSMQLDVIKNDVEENLYQERSSIIGGTTSTGIRIEEGSTIKIVIQENFLQLQLFAQCEGENENGNSFLRGYQIPIKGLSQDCQEQEVMLDQTSLGITFQEPTTDEVVACLQVN